MNQYAFLISYCLTIAVFIGYLYSRLLAPEVVDGKRVDDWKLACLCSSFGLSVLVLWALIAFFWLAGGGPDWLPDGFGYLAIIIPSAQAIIGNARIVVPGIPTRDFWGIAMRKALEETIPPGPKRDAFDLVRENFTSGGMSAKDDALERIREA